MGTYRKRFNEKARAGQMAKLRELKRIRNKQFFRHEFTNDSDNDDNDSMKKSESTISNEDTNAELLKPLTEEERSLKKRKLQELFTPKESKISRQKKKRLDKFIEHQLKREERKAIIQKLQGYKIDTSRLTSSKKLGHGRQTRKEEFAEALELERQGRGTNKTKDILYEEHEFKEWNDDKNDNSINKEEEEEKSDFESKFGDITTEAASSFIDNRPSKFGGQGFGFGFANIEVVKKEKKPSKRKYNWRQRVKLQGKKNQMLEDELDFESSFEEDDDEEEDENSIEEKNSKEEFNDNTESSNKEELEEEVSEESEESEGSEEELSSEKSEAKRRAEEFKEWANQEIKKIEGRDGNLETPTLNIEYKPIIREEDLDDGLETNNVPVDLNSKRKAFFVKVNRPEEIQQIRMQLPIFAEEHSIMEAIHHNDVVIICGETGSGKTTQVPQFLYESGFGSKDSDDYPGMIGITQPRRVAAVSMANRVSNELGDHGNKVAYQIRFDSTTKDDTRVKFMTDGVLLREMMHDFKLTKYSSIIIDEAHERNINTDILIGMLSRCVRLRAKEHDVDPMNCKKLKLIIMSATLRVSDFSENSTLFPIQPPILNISARQFPVSIHFNRKTAFNYVEEAFKKTCKIHRRLPPGAILVFLTGQQEITQMVKRLRKEFPFPKKHKHHKNGDNIATVWVNSKNTDLEVEDIDFSVKAVDEEQFNAEMQEESDIDGTSEDEEGFEEVLTEEQTPNDPLYVLPLYSLLPTKEQIRVFENPPPGSRLCVVATNVAETSLTIPNVRYVVDCGRSKERVYNEENGVQSFEIDWISKASADQRSGRAGRTGPGHCYRLYSSAVFERDFEQFSRPEILRMPVESIVLQMKSMAIHNIINFPFPTPPDRTMLANALQLLKYLGALDMKERITEDGKKMSLFPLSPRFSKMVLVSTEQNCLPYVVSIVSALSVGNPFISEFELGINEKVRNSESREGNDSGDETENNSIREEKKRELRIKFYKSRNRFSKLDPYSDAFRLLSVVSAIDYIPKLAREKFIEDNFLRGKLMEEIMKLRKQLTYIIKSNTSKENIAITVKDEDLKSNIPNETQLKLLKQMICAGFVDRVAIRADCIYPEDAKITNKINLVNIPYIPVMAQKSPIIEESFVYIHPASILSNLGELPPKYLVFHSLHLSNNNKTRMNALCDIKSTPLANIARKGQLLSYSKPLTSQGLKTINLSLNERVCYVVPRFGSSVDSDLKVGWDLNPIAVHQKKENGRWIVDKFLTNKNYKSIEQAQKS